MGANHGAREAAGRAWRGGAVALAMVLWARSAAGQSVCAQSADVDALEERGRTLRDEHHDAEALALFEQAYGMCHGGRALARVALAEGALGRWVEAEGHLRDAIGRRDDAWVSANQESLQRELATITAHLGDLELAGSGGPAEVWIDGRRVAAWPMAQALRVVAGSVTFAVRGDGWAPVTRTVVVPGGGLARETVVLVPLAVAGGGGGGAGVAAARGGGQRTVAWVLAGGAVLALAGGAVATGLRFASHATIFDDYLLHPMCRDVERDVAYCGDLYRRVEQRAADSGSTWGVLQGVGFGLGSALAVTAAVLFATAPSGRAATTRLVCGQGPGTLGVGCVWSF